MLFNTAEYIVFFSIVVVVYYLIPLKMRGLFLLISSYLFYMNWNWQYAFLLLIATLSTFFAALAIQHNKNADRMKKAVVAACCVLNFGILCFFKYTTFLLDNMNLLLRHAGARPVEYIWTFILPVGISFYIFQCMGYLFDVSAGKLEAEQSFIRYALFVSFFPQLVAGPIERAPNLLGQIRQIQERRYPDYDRIRSGFILILWGLFMKMVIADRLAVLVDHVFQDFESYGTYELVLAAVCFGFQIYCDFAGYSTIAIGSAKVLGFSLMDNFKEPYLSGSIKEFWRRWHISLSTWFRDYIYIPLGGSYCRKNRKRFNILVTMGISGLWHGAQWNFVAWGVLNGIYQIAEETTQPYIDRLNHFLGTKKNVFSYRLMRRVVTFLLVDFAWIFFRAPGLKAAFRYIKGMFLYYDPWVLFDGSLYNLGLEQVEIRILVASLVVLGLVDCVQYKTKKRIDSFLLEQNIWFRWLVLISLMMAILVFGVYGVNLDSSQFIYFQF